MKPILVFVVFAFISLNTRSQPNNSPHLALGVEKRSLDSKKEFVFKPNSSLKIKTENGRKFFSSNYFFTEKSIVINSNDTILFENISWIQGNVHNGGERKAMGVVVALISIPIIYIGIGETVIAGGVVGYFVTVPFIGMGYEGIRLIGARKFHLSRDCFIKTIEQ